MIKENNSTFISGQSIDHMIPSFANSVKSSMVYEGKLPGFVDNCNENYNTGNNLVQHPS